MASVKTNEGWVCLHDDDGDFVIFDKGRIVAVTDSDTEWDARNANRIAAAPDMYEALKGLIALAESGESVEEPLELIAAGREAIAKAEGRA